MKRPPLPRLSDVRGAARLAVDATLATTSLVEAMHAGIARVPGRVADERTGGISGLVYGGVRGVTRLVVGSAELLLRGLDRALPAVEGSAPTDPRREALLAALNGVLGDHLAVSGNPLAIPMALHSHGDADASPSGTLLLLVHGLCMNDLQWTTQGGHDHGQALARDLGFAPRYLRYNTGLHISTNGRALADLLEQQLAEREVLAQRLVLLCHSMGGLVARSAIHHAHEAGMAWPSKLSDIVFLGTPHLGAPLERAGHWVDRVLGAAPYAAPLARLGHLRSAGITDLRHASLLDEDWSGRSRFVRSAALPRVVPLPAKVRCHAVAASIGQRRGDAKDRLLGDGLVPLDSALGRHAEPARSLHFPLRRQFVRYGVDHWGLLHDAAVYERLRRWLAPAT